MKNIFNLANKYNAIAGIVLIGVVLAILILLALIRPAWGRLDQLGSEIPIEQQKRDLTKQDFERLEKAKTFLDENPQTVEEVNTAVPVQPEVPSILIVLESLAKQNGVFMTSFTPQQLGQSSQAQPGTSGGAASQTANPSGVDAVEITANFRGQYSSLINFLYNLERSLRIVDVKTITVSTSSGVLEGNISFKAYYKQVEGGPTAPTGATGGTP